MPTISKTNQQIQYVMPAKIHAGNYHETAVDVAQKDPSFAVA